MKAFGKNVTWGSRGAAPTGITMTNVASGEKANAAPESKICLTEEAHSSFKSLGMVLLYVHAVCVLQ